MPASGKRESSSRVIRTPDRRLRVFVSSTLKELKPERGTARAALERLRLAPIMFEAGARPHPPRELYRAYLGQSDVFVGIYWQSYGWVAPGDEVSGLEEEYRLAGEIPRLIYIKEPSPEREQRLAELLAEVKADDGVSYKRFGEAEDLAELIADDIALLLAERFESGAADRSAGGGPSDPPRPLTETVGRGEEIAEVSEALRGGSRLLTLTGAGGIGKTRLALEVARGSFGEFPGGVHFVPLAPITDPALVVPTIADRVGAPVEGSRSAEEAVADRLGNEPALLVLDNLEQVADAGGALAALLERCPGLRILATSRQALRVRGEREIAVAPLPVPDPALPLQQLREQPAVRLFSERAADAAPGFRLDEANAPAVAELCARLDGLPLAIELAAARSRLLPPPALLERIEQRFDALGEGGPDLPPRQRTLRAAIDWSHDLLDEPERALFARLAVFEGGFSLEAAEAVCGLDGDPPVIETLASLIDKTLVLPTSDRREGRPWFRILETVRAYALERLEERGETETMRRRHLDWYSEMADEAQPFLCGPGQREWAARFDPERANLRAAAGAAIDLGDDEALIEFVWDVLVFYFVRDAVYEPHSWMERVAAAGRPLNAVLRAKLGSLLALMRILRGEYEGAREALESALEVFGAQGMEFESAVALKELAWVHYLIDRDQAGAIESLRESSRLFDRVEHDWGVALVEIQLGSVLAASGDLEGGEDSFRRSLERSRRIDNEPLIGQALQHLAMARILAGRDDEAVPLLGEAAELARRGRHRSEATSCLDALGAVALARGDARSAAAALAVAERTREELGITPWPSVQSFVTALADGVREALGAQEVESVLAAARDRDLFESLQASLDAVAAAAVR